MSPFYHILEDSRQPCPQGGKKTLSRKGLLSEKTQKGPEIKGPTQALRISPELLVSISSWTSGSLVSPSKSFEPPCLTFLPVAKRDNKPGCHTMHIKCPQGVRKGGRLLEGESCQHVFSWSSGISSVWNPSLEHVVLPLRSQMRDRINGAKRLPSLVSAARQMSQTAWWLVSLLHSLTLCTLFSKEGACCWHGWKIKHSHSIATATWVFYHNFCAGTFCPQKPFLHPDGWDQEYFQFLKLGHKSLSCLQGGVAPEKIPSVHGLQLFLKCIQKSRRNHALLIFF